MLEKLIWIVGVPLLAFAIYCSYEQQKECEASGGVLVRAMSGVVCLKR